VAEIDSLSLLMNCVHDGMGATIKPMAAVYLEGARGRQWRALSITGARMSRRNYIYSLAPERLSTAAAVVAAELRDTARALIESGAWTGVQTIEQIRALPAAATTGPRAQDRATA
jgi:LysR family tcuABC transcriptional regulator